MMKPKTSIKSGILEFNPAPLRDMVSILREILTSSGGKYLH